MVHHAARQLPGTLLAAMGILLLGAVLALGAVEPGLSFDPGKASPGQQVTLFDRRAWSVTQRVGTPVP
jgi:hypothetical protein